MTWSSAVCLCADRNMLIPAMFVASAVNAHRTDAGVFDVILFTAAGEAEPGQRAWLEERCIRLVDDLDLSPLDDLPATTKRLTRATFIRLLVPQYLEGRYNLVLYLDCDLTIHGDVGRLLSLDTGTCAVAASPAARIWAGWTEPLREKAHAQFRALGMTEPYAFFNTGVLLIDVRKWNERELGPRTLHFYRHNSELCPLPDEHALNAILDGAMVAISPVWNMRIKAWSHRLVRDHVRPVIVHYDGPLKPWQRLADGMPLFAEPHRRYEALLAGTEWAGWLRDQRIRAGDSDAGGAGNEANEADASLAESRDEYARAFRDYCATAAFADIEQGLVRRDGGCLRLS
jgi:hypothetical protein